MKGLNYIQKKQVAWALANGFIPQGSTYDNKGEYHYLTELKDNLFQPLSDFTLNQFKNADGGEFNDYEKNGNRYRPKVNALHSSSVIVMNTFQYWLDKNIFQLLHALELCSKRSVQVSSVKREEVKIEFEKKIRISNDLSKFKFSPNIDVVVNNQFAIESKFTEPYKGRKKGISEKYTLENEIWKGLEFIYELANELHPNNERYNYLDAAQLIKHILGLKVQNKNKKFTLLYLWYDTLGNDGALHQSEIEDFAKIAKLDNIKFKHISYQKFISNLMANYYYEHKEYCNYITKRYL